MLGHTLVRADDDTIGGIDDAIGRIAEDGFLLVEQLLNFLFLFFAFGHIAHRCTDADSAPANSRQARQADLDRELAAVLAQAAQVSLGSAHGARFAHLQETLAQRRVLGPYGVWH